jgi:uncharacterized protein
MTPFVSNLRVYPIKSLDPINVKAVTIGVRSLQYDREFALFTPDGRYLNGKRTGLVNQLETRYGPDNYQVHFARRGTTDFSSFHLIDEKERIEGYLSNFFGMPVCLQQNTEGRLLDIPDRSSVTVVSQATLETLSEVMPGIELEEMRLRFRANIEISGVAPYWEEHLFKEPGMGVVFQVGEVRLIGISPRARCNVPPRNPYTGETDKQFVKKMIAARQASLPSWSQLKTYGGYYHLTVDTFIPDTERGKHIQLGESVKILGPIKLSV